MKKCISLAVVAVFITALTGCESTKQYGWYKRGVSEQATYAYSEECRYNVGMNKLSLEKEQRMFDACMHKAGFRWVRLN